MERGNFFMLVGIAGSGKSTMARELAEGTDAVWLSSDKIRGEIYGDENCQDNPKRVFDIMNQRAMMAIDEGLDVIYDATNLRADRRMELLKQLRPQTATCLVCDTNPEVCIARQNARERKVPAEVIQKQYEYMQFPMPDEGWDKIRIFEEV